MWWFRCAAPSAEPHTDIHAAVSGHHHEGDIRANQAALPRRMQFVIHLDQTGQSRRAVLEQVMDVSDPVRRFRIAGGHHHRATGLEQHHNVAFQDTEYLVQHGKSATARAGAMSRCNPAGYFGHCPQRLEFDLQLAGIRILPHLGHATRHL